MNREANIATRLQKEGLILFNGYILVVEQGDTLGIPLGVFFAIDNPLIAKRSITVPEEQEEFPNTFGAVRIDAGPRHFFFRSLDAGPLGIELVTSGLQLFFLPTLIHNHVRKRDVRTELI